MLSKVHSQMTGILAEHPGYNLVITGHSLGGGTAVLITLDLLLGGHAYLLPFRTAVFCIALALPPVYRSQSELQAHISNAIEVYINNSDCVPRLSLGSIANLLASMRVIDDMGLTLTALLVEKMM